jgi:CxC2 like cysteine cluster associated with KDZ transposases
MGLRVQLGHYPGTTCRKPKPAHGDDFVVIDVHGIHDIALDFCGCEHEVSHFKQLLRARWFPATVTDPRTAATFAVLEFFHILSFESKVSAYEFYHCLARRTDNTGITPIRVSLPSTFILLYHLI